MTWEELEQKHAEIIQESLENVITHDFEIAAHSKTSVEYTIEVLYELLEKQTDLSYWGIKAKITELRNLIK